jgi:hypothetical protein
VIPVFQINQTNPHSRGATLAQIAAAISSGGFFTNLNVSGNLSVGGQGTIGNPTGGFCGVGCLNAQALEINGVAVVGGGGITGPGTSVNGDAVIWSGTTGSAVADAGAAPFLVTGGTISGAVSITGITTLTGGVTGNAVFGVGSSGAGTGITVNNELLARFLHTQGLTWNQTSTAITPLVNSLGTFTGTVTGAADINRFTVTSDTMNGTGANDGVVKDINATMNVTGAASGGRTAVWAQITPSSLSNMVEVVPIQATILANSNMGGSFLQPLATDVTLFSGATNVGSTINECDVSAMSGAAAPSVKGCWQFTLGTGDAVAGSTIDAALILTSANLAGVSPGWKQLIQLSGGAQGFPAAVTGGMVGYTDQTVNGGNGENGQFIAPKWDHFAALASVYTSGNFIAAPGFYVDGWGDLNLSNLHIAYNSSGPTIDATGYMVTAITITSPGGGTGNGLANYFPGDILRDGLNGLYPIATTKVRAATVFASGSGGTNGACVVTTTTGTGTQAQLSGTVTGGALTNPLTVSIAGSFTTNPDLTHNSAQEPVTGCGLTGAKVGLGIGAATFAPIGTSAGNSVPGISALGTPTSVTMLGGSGPQGNQPVATLTWGQRNTLGLNPSGGPVLSKGALTVSLSPSTFPAALSGSVIRGMNIDTTISRSELDAFGAASHFSSVRYNGTAASISALLATNEIGSFNAWGYDGTAISTGPQAAFRTFANQNWSVGSHGTYADVATTPNSSTTLTSVLRFENDGGITTPGVTGGDQGIGTINAAGLYSNGNPVVADAPVDAVYTVGGAISPTCHFAVLNAGSAQSYTLAAGADGHTVTIYNYGAGTATVTLTLGGTSSAVTIAKGGVLGVKEWAAQSTWILAN